jgi:Putative adhesin
MMTKRIIPVLFLITVASAPLPAHEIARESQQIGAGDDWCRGDRRGNSDREVFCEVRQFSVTAAGTLTVDAEPNGGIEVEGGPRNDVQVWAKVTAQADTMQRARQIADSVKINAAAPNVSADGPTGLGRREWWSVSYRLAVPAVSSLALRTTNGGISIRDVDGQIEFKTVNGGVKLSNLAGDVKGRTSNGGVDVDLEGPSWKGEGLDVETSNGGVHLRIPEQYSAHLETGTVNGGFNIDFPITVRGRIDRQISADLGAGGAPIRVHTHNGGVKVSKK